MTGAPKAASAELVDVIDDAGAVIDAVPRARVRSENLLHRAVFVAVITTSDEVVVHQRAAWKDVWPSRWDVCFGGVVDAGETLAAAARRELHEEAGIHVPVDRFDYLGASLYEDDAVREIGSVYLVRHDGPFEFADGEVVASDLVSRSDLPSWMADREVCPDSADLVVPRLLGTATAGIDLAEMAEQAAKDDL